MEIERLGPLRGSSVVFGDVTFLMGLPNTGKSYILRALYEHLLFGDPPTVLSCMDVHAGPEFPDRVVSIDVDLSRLVVRQEHRTVVVEAQDVRVCFDAAKLFEVVRVAVSACTRVALVPEDAVTRLEYSIHEQWDKMRDRLVNMFVSEFIRRIGKAYPDAVFEAMGEKTCAYIPRVKTRVKGVTVQLTRYLEPRHRRSSIQEEILRRIFVQMIRTRIGELVEPNKIVYSVLQRLLVESFHGRVVYATYGRTLLSQVMLYMLLRPDEYDVVGIERVFGTRYLPALSLYHALREGYRVLKESVELKKKLNTIFGPMLRGRVELSEAEILYSSDGVQVPLSLASALAGEAVALMLASAPILKVGRGWLLVEEPEAQLHPAIQVLVPVVLYSLATAGVRLVVTTHSPILAGVAATLSRLARGNPEKLRNAIAGLLKRFGFAGDAADELVANLAEALPKLNVKFYYVGGGKVQSRTPEEMESGIPTYTEVPLELAKWDLETSSLP